MKKWKLTKHLLEINTELLIKYQELLKEALNEINLKDNEQIETIKHLLNCIQNLKDIIKKLTEQLQILEEEDKINGN